MTDAARRRLNPVLFQGNLRAKNYFEGWYFKHVSADRRSVFALIPGVSLSAKGSRSFVQFIDGSTGATRWFPYPLEAFGYSLDRFEVGVGNNTFSLAGVQARLEDENGVIEARLSYAGITPLPSTLLWPGIMGPYSFVPFLECNHGLVSLDHRVDGRVSAGGAVLNMDGGRGYIEKDWGSSMPSAWIWCQSNSFPRPGVSLMFSLADIPWLGGSFPGFLCAALLPGPAAGAPGRVRVWASWNGSRVESLESGDRCISAAISRRGERLELRMERGRGGLLRAPAAGAMDRRIAESVDAVLAVRLTGPAGVIFEGTARPAGLETVGDLSLLGPGRA